MNRSIVLAQCLMSLGILGWLWYKPCARLRRDNFRSQIRRIREDLFDFMWKNGHDFGNPAYRATRQMLNGLIRSSNYLSTITFLHVAATVLNGPKRPPVPMTIAIEKLPDGPLKAKINEAIQQAVKEVLHFIFFQNISGLVVWSLVGVAYCIYALRKRLKRNGIPVEKRELVERPTYHLLDDAYVVGSPTASPESMAVLAR